MMFYSKDWQLSDGNQDNVSVGIFASGIANVVGGLITPPAEEATLTLAVMIGALTFNLPEIDFSGPAALFPFVLPIMDAGEWNLSYSLAVTGSGGGYTIQFSV
jgi:hypothetical protein